MTIFIAKSVAECTLFILDCFKLFGSSGANTTDATCVANYRASPSNYNKTTLE